ncbi:hypothetical protein HYDPIDRAFT_26204 [Hydnomerulius pinastri MD-312]|nr:hypothetical protein HYDPIDRAFT_26204 [Hydnomerulius pinastri MD-312]
MSSVGEKQYYALALIQKLMDHLPSDMCVGLLYDIGCQLERSCRKWNFFDEAVLSCFEFAISVFHTYGHQWPCQVIYHPRKHEGFGLLDGFLVIINACLFSIFKSAIWMSSHQPLSPTGSYADGSFVRILELEEAVVACACKVSNLEMEMMLRPRSCTHDLTTDLEDAREQHYRLRNTICRRREALGVSATASLANLRNNEYFCTRMNTLMLKARIRKHLRDRKFELQRIERLYRLAMNDVREGIWCLLQRDRCVEEEKRLGREHCYLQEWASEEWNVLERLREGLDDEGDCDMVFAVDESWGPVQVDVGMEAGQVGDDMEDSEDGWDSEEEVGDDDQLLYELEDWALGDKFRNDEVEEWEDLEDDTFGVSQSSPTRPH